MIVEVSDKVKLMVTTDFRTTNLIDVNWTLTVINTL